MILLNCAKLYLKCVIKDTVRYINWIAIYVLGELKMLIVLLGGIIKLDIKYITKSTIDLADLKIK